MKTEVKEIIIGCSHCGWKNSKQIKVHPASSYTKPDEASILIQFWCTNCEEAQAARFKVSKVSGLKLDKRVEPTSLFLPTKPKTGITIRPRAKRKDK